MKTETQIENYKAVLADAKKEFGDFTQSEAWEIINKAAHSIETQIIESNYAYSNDSRSKTSALFRIASRMRKDLEDEIGPQPGFSKRKIIATDPK